MVKNPPVKAGDAGGVISGSGRSPGEEMATHSSILAWENAKDRGTWWATVHGTAESQTRLSDTHTVDLQQCLYFRCTAK